ncbi:MAG TPA: MFS transporter [Gemmataceae bacterium]|jgi:ACS family tartrate transporter-like MFS transporter|nr:MFS transporter [Gemmataceae bacterium]
MASDGLSQTTETDSRAWSVRRKVAWRLLPLIFVLYVVAYLDRANLSFARRQMMADLEFSNIVYGWGVGIFFVGYLLLEIPGALLVEHWSARKWFTRILVTWGACSMGMALVRTENQFYIARFLLGLAEAGFFPGVIVYLTHWFPKRERARALAGLVFGVPASLALGAYTSGQLLSLDWFGLSGWQWMFLFEGAPAIGLGVFVWLVLPDRPQHARWLAPAERDWLLEQLAAERREDAGVVPASLKQALKTPTVWLLAFGIMAINTGGYALVFWLPMAIRGMLEVDGNSVADKTVLMWTGIVYLCGVLGIWVSSRLSDWTGERKWFCVGGVWLAAAGLALSVIPGQPWAIMFLWLCVAGFGAFFWIPPFWVLPTATLTASAAAVAVGVINMSANLAGLFGSPVVGAMKDAGLDNSACLLFLAGCYAMGGGVISLIGVARKPLEAAITRRKCLANRPREHQS